VWAHWNNSSRVDVVPFGHILIRSQPVFANKYNGQKKKAQQNIQMFCYINII
jgi:hypothetical protein